MSGPLFVACQNGNIDIVRTMVQQDKQNNFDYNDGLCGACENGHMEIVKLMISKGANDYNRELYYACVNCENIDIVKLMIEYGANDYDLGLYYAQQNNHYKSIKIIQLLIEKMNEKEIIYKYFSFPKDEDVIRTFVSSSQSLSLKLFKKMKGYNQLVNRIKEREKFIFPIINVYIDLNIYNFVFKEYILNDF